MFSFYLLMGLTVYRVSAFGQCVMNCIRNWGNEKKVLFMEGCQCTVLYPGHWSIYLVTAKPRSFPISSPMSIVAWFSLHLSPDLLFSCLQNSRLQALALWPSFLVCIFNFSSLSTAFRSDPAQLCQVGSREVSVPFTAYVFCKKYVISEKTAQVEAWIPTNEVC